MIVYLLSDEAIAELSYAVDEAESFGHPVRVAIDGGLKVKVSEGAWSRPLNITTEGKPDELPAADLRTLLDYDWSAEERDYDENPSERHIFLAMQRLNDWLTDFEPS